MDHFEHHGHDTHQHGRGCGHTTIPHGDHEDYLHAGHRHAAHEGHWDEHADRIGVSRSDSGAAASTWDAGPEDRPEGAGDVGGS